MPMALNLPRDCAERAQLLLLAAIVFFSQHKTFSWDKLRCN